MAGVSEIGQELVQTALTFAPWLEDVPVLGRILRVIAPGGGDDIHAAEQLLAEINKKKQDRKTRIEKNNRYVLKASDAMRCVEENLENAGALLALGKAILNTVAGKPATSAPDILEDRIFSCIESKVLKQTSPRVRKKVSYSARPARGHGKGRKSIAKHP